MRTSAFRWRWTRFSSRQIEARTLASGGQSRIGTHPAPTAIDTAAAQGHDSMVPDVEPRNPSRRFVFAGMALFALPLLAASAHAAPADRADAQGQASAKVIQPISAWAVEDLDFGTVAVSQTEGGTVEVGVVGGNVRYSGAAGSACGRGSCGAHPARFTVKGEANRRYEVLLPAVVHATGGQGGATLDVTGLAMQTESLPEVGAAGLLDSSGSDEFRVGGTLQVPASTPPDHYDAKILVIVTYG